MEEVANDVNPVVEGARIAGVHSAAKARNARLAAQDLPPSPVPPITGVDEELRKKYITEFARMGGKKGGPARAAKLSAEERRAIGRKGGLARWGKHI